MDDAIQNLKPRQKYLLKWRSVKSNGQIHNMIILEGEFIKHYNDEYCNAHNIYIGAPPPPPVPPPPPPPVPPVPPPDPIEVLTGPILTPEDLRYVTYQFEDPLYPYSQMSIKRPFGQGCKIGLFRITGIRKSIFKGQERPFRGRPEEPEGNPYKFVSLSQYTLINTDSIIYNETLMWVDLNQVQIKPVVNKEKLFQEKAVDTYSNALNTDVLSVVKEFLGGKKPNVKEILPCPEGKKRNPKTKRCIKIQTKKSATKLKPCPEGKKKKSKNKAMH
jgi:hypothetical protein